MPPDYSGQNLRGRSFKGQNLEGANFSGADIRSTNFTGANLTSANFSHAKAGLQRRWATFLVVVSWVLMGLSGFFSAFASATVAFLLFNTDKDYQLAFQIAGWTTIVILVIFFFVTIRRGMQAGLGAFAVAYTGTVAFTFAVAGAGTVAFTFAFAVVVAFAGAFAGAFAVAGAYTGGGAGAFAVAIAVGYGVVYAGVGAFAVPYVGAVVLFSTYISGRALKGDPKHALIHNIAVVFAAIGGTNFCNADLSNADFSNATLKSTDFRKAILTRTCFHKTKKLDRVRPGITYLQKTQVCQVLVRGRVQNNNFDRQDLRGVKFKGATLIDASFIGADLSLANLQDVDLSRAKLVQTQLDGTDLTRAILTGAYIQDWGITRDTKFDGVRCEYIYMRLPTKENPDPLRKPDNNKEVFADGEFGDFIQPIFDTLDLYHNQGVDPRAIAVAFKELAENNPSAELEIVAIERRGEDKILLRVKTVATANKSELSKEYFINYNHLKALAEKDFKALITDKESQILRLENMIMRTLERPSFYAENYHNQGDTVMSEDSKQQINNDLRNAQFAGGLVNAEIVNAEQIGGNIINYADKQNLAEAAAEIQQLLTQLQNQGLTTEQAQQQAAQDLAKKADNDPTVLGKLVKWGHSLGNTAANTTVTEVVKEVFKMALRLSGIPIP